MTDPTILLHALILGIVEGLTEFLPVSSTGHLILVGQLLNFNDDKGKVFEIAIQFAAILAVVWEYRARLGHALVNVTTEPASRRLAINLFVAFLPAAVLGFLFIKQIKHYLFNPIVVASALIIGGVLILWAERRKHVVRAETVDDMTWRDALKVGFAQALAMIPGTSRSGATIIGGLFFGLSRKTATEFSFFLAIPTMFAATFYDVFKNRALFSADDIGLFAVGSAASFISALLAVRGLIRFISRHDFTVFAWYRIVFGLLVLLSAYTGWVDWGVGAH
ncbi:MAG: undecaprenyl-diphosphatase [Thiobacillus sp. 63-78]|uniref:undecaprenyl-diphosphate phosphatase n=1 Tax=Thiobacillus sp. 63-78 TaxID=1895859 RepID=UPI000962347B|nr:undecaprenyl-diphosphate phosphatase [Thiobacillus sp. 63-78]MBN8762763.1 undecaprenyl-diphosphate phosphatase [Thiobacillus sp.]MBN8773309.1 undecaprenyl-diphosphate phosphatase [Thiobacillus sp.]OJZ04271.1 MAG: undecaprenyl-diphosphatase [Thiobacillus sp. 63-78]